MILCCGEALIDMLPRDLGGQPAFAPHPGGAVFNTAIALGRLGATTGFFSGLSTDLFGDQLTEALKASHVTSDLAVRTARPTTLAFVRLVDGQASYAFYDENTAGRMLSKADLPTLLDHVTAMFFGGISLVAEPCGTVYEGLMQREAGRRVMMLDPNIRPGFITDEGAYRARIGRMIAMSDIVKVSDEDLHWLEGPGDLAALARGLCARGPQLVCVTQGAQGAWGITAEQAVFVPARKVAVVDTVGAGDTFNAGVLAALRLAGLCKGGRLARLEPGQIEAALTRGSAAAAITVSRAGANPPWAHEI